MKYIVIDTDSKEEMLRRINDHATNGWCLVGPVQITNNGEQHFYLATMESK